QHFAHRAAWGRSIRGSQREEREKGRAFQVAGKQETARSERGLESARLALRLQVTGEQARPFEGDLLVAWRLAAHAVDVGEDVTRRRRPARRTQALQACGTPIGVGLSEQGEVD